MIKPINANGGISSSRSIYLNETAESREKLFICNKLDAGIFFPLISDCQVHLHLTLLESLKNEDIRGKTHSGSCSKATKDLAPSSGRSR